MSKNYSFHHYVEYGSDDSDSNISDSTNSNFAIVSELSDNSYLEWFKKAQNVLVKYNIKDPVTIPDEEYSEWCEDLYDMDLTDEEFILLGGLCEHRTNFFNYEPLNKMDKELEEGVLKKYSLTDPRNLTMKQRQEWSLLVNNLSHNGSLTESDARLLYTIFKL